MPHPIILDWSWPLKWPVGCSLVPAQDLPPTLSLSGGVSLGGSAASLGPMSVPVPPLTHQHQHHHIQHTAVHRYNSKVYLTEMALCFNLSSIKYQ